MIYLEGIFQIVLLLILFVGIIVMPLIRQIRKWNRKRRYNRTHDDNGEVRRFSSIFPVNPRRSNTDADLEEETYKPLESAESGRMGVPAAERLQKQLDRHSPLRRGVLWAEILGPPVSLRSSRSRED